MGNNNTEKHEVEVDLGVFGEIASSLHSSQKTLTFKEISKRNTARIWNVYSETKALLGTIRWYKERNRYVFEPEGWCVFDTEMLDEINAVMKNHKLLNN